MAVCSFPAEPLLPWRLVTKRMPPINARRIQAPAGLLFWSRGSLGNPMEDWNIVLGMREQWGQESPFVLEPNDRRHHLYTIGKSRTGKTTFLHNLIVQDICSGMREATMPSTTRKVSWRVHYLSRSAMPPSAKRDRNRFGCRRYAWWGRTVKSHTSAGPIHATFSAVFGCARRCF